MPQRKYNISEVSEYSDVSESPLASPSETRKEKRKKNPNKEKLLNDESMTNSAGGTFEDEKISRPSSYRGFSSSICDMFTDPNDCCALVCCGVLAVDRTRYLLTGERPTSWKWRLFKHFMLPLIIFVTAGYCSVYIRDQKLNEAVSTILILLLVLYILMDCLKARESRMELRDQIADRVGKRAEQSSRDVAGAHSICCGCARVDGNWNSWPSNTPERADMCTSIWLFFAKSCFGVCAGYFCQMCGICAVAQEAREVKRVVETSDQQELQWIDYVTFEPYAEYFHKIVALRIAQNHSLKDHYDGLSKLSSLLLRNLGVVTVSLLILSFIQIGNGQIEFSYLNVLVFMATFIQSFVILYIIHWIKHKFDISLDAIIKYFASGFLLASGLSVFFETVVAMVLQVFFAIIVAITGGYPDVKIQQNNLPNGTDPYLTYYGIDHPVAAIFYLILVSFILAAFVEELCKYFGYIMVQHPDFMIKEAQQVLAPPPSYAPTPPRGNKARDDEDEEEEDDDEDENEERKPIPSLTAPPRSLNSVGVGVTIAMISVALGFTCCENLLYVFVYTDGNIGSEITVLIARSFFPVHALAAALQSIGVCKRELEGVSEHRVGRVVLPGIILHGAFDFALMLSSFLLDRRYIILKNAGMLDDDDDGFRGWISFLCATCITLIGFGYYYYASNEQKKRLEQKENEPSFGSSNSYNPDDISPDMINNDSKTNEIV